MTAFTVYHRIESSVIQEFEQIQQKERENLVNEQPSVSSCAIILISKLLIANNEKVTLSWELKDRQKATISTTQNPNSQKAGWDPRIQNSATVLPIYINE